MIPLAGTTFVRLGPDWVNPDHVVRVRGLRTFGSPPTVQVFTADGKSFTIDQDGLRTTEDVVRKLTQQEDE